MSKKRSNFGNAIKGTVAGLALLLATSCGTTKMASTYNTNSVPTGNKTTVLTNGFTNGVNLNTSNTSEFGTRYSANKVLTEKEQLALRKKLYPNNPNLTIAHENVYLVPIVVGNDTTGFTMNVVSDVLRCTKISKESGLLIEQRNKDKKPVVKYSPSVITGDVARDRNFGLGISPESRNELNGNAFGVSLDANMFNFLASLKIPSFSSPDNTLEAYETSDFIRQNSPRDITYVVTRTDREGSINQDFGFGFGLGYQLNLGKSNSGHFNLGLTGNAQQSNVSMSNSLEEISKNTYSSLTGEFIEPENASLIPKTTTTDEHSGWYMGGDLRASYEFQNGFEIGLKGGLMVPVNEMKEFKFNGEKVSTSPVKNLGLMLRYNF